MGLRETYVKMKKESTQFEILFLREGRKTYLFDMSVI